REETVAARDRAPVAIDAHHVQPPAARGLAEHLAPEAQARLAARERAAFAALPAARLEREETLDLRAEIVAGAAHHLGIARLLGEPPVLAPQILAQVHGHLLEVG